MIANGVDLWEADELVKRGDYMEAHKDYRNAIRDLPQLADRLGVPMVYLGV